MSFNSLSVNQNRAVNNLSKYIIGAEINQQGESSGIVSGAALMGGISGTGWLWKNRKNIKGGIQQLNADANTQKNIVNSAKKYPSNARFSSLRNKWAGANEYVNKANLENLSQKLAKKPEYASIKNYIDNGLKSGKNYTELLKDVEKMQAVQKLNLYEAKVAKQVASGSKLRAVKNATGITKLSKATKQLAAKSGKFRGLLKGVKGNAGFALVSFGIGVLTDVIPAFSLGTDKGFKQLGKTAAKTGAEVAGWAAGMALGAKAGAVIGTCIGGPIGTVVGGAIGLIGGFVGSFLASKLADKVVGPSEVEIAEKEAAEEISQSARTDIENLDELAQKSYEQLIENAKTGQLTENDLIAKKSLEELIGAEIDLDAEVQARLQEEAAQKHERSADNTPSYEVPYRPEETVKNETPAYTAPSPWTSPYSAPQFTFPTFGMTNTLSPFAMNNTNNNPYGNPFSNDMYFQKMFGYNTNPYQMYNQGQTFQNYA